MSADLLSNMLSQIKNASMVKKPFIEIAYSRECEAVADVLKNAGYLENVKSFKEPNKAFKKLHLDLAYANEESVLTDVKRVSKPGRRVYSAAADIGKYMSGYGMYVVSTSRGIMSGAEAKKKKLGGEVICKIH